MGSSTGTTTTQTSNVPWNSSQLGAVQNQAVNLMNTDSLNYYGGQTYAQPTSAQTSGYANAANTMSNAGNATSGLVPGAQSAALNANTNIAGGSGMNDIAPLIGGLAGLGGVNPSGGAS